MPGFKLTASSGIALLGARMNPRHQSQKTRFIMALREFLAGGQPGYS
jgi:hypothetical protein